MSHSTFPCSWNWERGDHFAQTGGRLSRSLVDRVEAQGGVVKDTITRDTSVLIAFKDESSSKVTKAKEKSLFIISCAVLERELARLEHNHRGGGGISSAAAAAGASLRFSIPAASSALPSAPPSCYSTEEVDKMAGGGRKRDRLAAATRDVSDSRDEMLRAAPKAAGDDEEPEEEGAGAGDKRPRVHG